MGGVRGDNFLEGDATGDDVVVGVVVVEVVECCGVVVVVVEVVECCGEGVEVVLLPRAALIVSELRCSIGQFSPRGHHPPLMMKSVQRTSFLSAS